MKPIDALALLGSNRVIWIDDQFGIDTAEDLARLLGENLEVSRGLDLPKFEAIFERIDNEDGDAYTDLIELLKEVDSQELSDIARRFHAGSAIANQGTVDLDHDQIKTVQEQLAIKASDSWSFERAERLMSDQAASDEGDSHITYIVDLQDRNGALGNERGLDLLKVLGRSKSRATSFLLTRNATKASEAILEDTLRAKLMEDDHSADESPICVIAKERLEGGKGVIVDGLKVAIKRAGLRRGVHEVLLRADAELKDAFNGARKRLLRIPPEQLDHYVVDRAYKEGVSELHVVERALSASMSERFKKLFATDPQAINGAARFRQLRPIRLDPPTTPSADLEAFRRMELWESSELVNTSYSLLACGDVFVAKADGISEATQAERFILLVQPCDVMLRPDGSRDFDTGVLVQISPRDPEDKNAGSLKKPLLPFILEGQEWICEFRKAATVSLSILDTASWRADGSVAYAHSDDKKFPSAFLPGQLKNAQRVAAAFEVALTQRAQLGANDPEWFMPNCRLTLSNVKVFLRFVTPSFVAKTITVQKNKPSIQTGAFSWNLQRIGRVRMPYAAALLSNYLAVQGREAFDLEYLKSDGRSCASNCDFDSALAGDDQEVQIPLQLQPQILSAHAPPERSGILGWAVRLFARVKAHVASLFI